MCCFKTKHLFLIPPTGFRALRVNDRRALLVTHDAKRLVSVFTRDKQLSSKVNSRSKPGRATFCLSPKSLFISHCGYCLSPPSVQRVPLNADGCALCQMDVYGASQPAANINCSVNAKTTVRRPARSVIIMFHTIWSLLFQSVGVFSF